MEPEEFIVQASDHLRDRQEVGHRNGDVPPQSLLFQRLEQADAQPARRQHAHMPEALVLLP